VVVQESIAMVTSFWTLIDSNFLISTGIPGQIEMLQFKCAH